MGVCMGVWVYECMSVGWVCVCGGDGGGVWVYVCVDV